MSFCKFPFKSELYKAANSSRESSDAKSGMKWRASRKAQRNARKNTGLNDFLTYEAKGGIHPDMGWSPLFYSADIHNSLSVEQQVMFGYSWWPVPKTSPNWSIRYRLHFSSSRMLSYWHRPIAWRPFFRLLETTRPMWEPIPFAPTWQSYYWSLHRRTPSEYRSSAWPFWTAGSWSSSL